MAIGAQVEAYKLSEMGKLCDYPIENPVNCKKTASELEAIYSTLIGQGAHLPHGCVLDEVTTGSRYVYWNPNGVTAGSLDPNIQQVCYNR